MKITLAQRHLFNVSKPMMEIEGVEKTIQWNECDLTGCPPYREKGSMTKHGKFPSYKYEELPETFTDTNGNEHRVEDITAYWSSK